MQGRLRLSCVVVVLVLGVTAWLYAPGIHGPALLDDRTSVTLLDTGVGARQLIEQVFGDGSGPLGRPLTMATFVVERALLGADLRWSKAVNIGLHLVNGLLLGWFLLLLLRIEKYPYATRLAVLAAGLWLVAPLWVSTVLYAVQRMAMLASTFMLLALIAYVHWRQRYVSGQRARWNSLLVFVCIGCAVFAKENGIVVVPILIFLELLWFGCRRGDGIDRKLLYGALGLLILGCFLVLWVFLLYPERLLSQYALRDFTLGERLLTQSRILWDYLGQLVWPDTPRMGLYHDDVVVSQSLMQPIVTLYAVLAWSGVLLIAVALTRFALGRRMAFCILFYLAGHSIESTVLPLELYFEHRNYFPAIGVFLLLALLLAEVSRRWRNVAKSLLAYFTLVMVMSSFQASSQVEIWSNSYLLRFNQINAHPRSFRANADMAVMYARVGSLERALDYSARAHEVTLERRGDYFIRNLALSCISGQRLPASVPGPEVLESVRPLSSVATLHALVKMLQDDHCAQLDRVAIADSLAHVYLRPDAQATAAAEIYSLLAVLENALVRYGNAYEYTLRFRDQAPGSTRGLLMQLHFATALGKVEVAEQMIAALQAKQASGELKVGEQQTLSLYTEQP